MQTSTGVYLEEMFASVTCVSKQSKISVFSVLYADMQISVHQGVCLLLSKLCLMFQFLLAKRRIHSDLLILPALSFANVGLELGSIGLVFKDAK